MWRANSNCARESSPAPNEDPVGHNHRLASDRGDSLEREGAIACERRGGIERASGEGVALNPAGRPANELEEDSAKGWRARFMPKRRRGSKGGDSPVGACCER